MTVLLWSPCFTRYPPTFLPARRSRCVGAKARS